MVCFDLEGVLVPEFWEEFSKATGIPELMLTTRDEPDYDKLMKMRIRVLKEHGFTMKEISEVVSKMNALPGAREFVDWVKTVAQPCILTGSYYEYITPLVAKLGYPFMFANSLEIDSKGNIVGYKLRENDGKVEQIKRFKEAGYEVIAVGDSFNDVKMLKEADTGILFKACAALKRQEKQLRKAENYSELKKILEELLD
ncbi:MAG: bifunctional phosphoserine phosphatase/homoserine phosphotransferase ThrH [Candidatus Diapherotrites archaeon]|nr:bifunctional phosphoserine phosphatase/homoserine phosphotransferase ThrH [Candidatus Diapherotrites archaeon]